MSIPIDELAPLVHEALEDVGWPPESIEILVDRLKRLEYGIPAEHEFMALAIWLGRCKFIHQLRQEQYPKTLSSKIRIPDLIATFATVDADKCVLVEVKSTNLKKLSWSEPYLHSLLDYSNMVGLPLMLATRWRFLNLWTLNDISVFKRTENGSYRLDWDTAQKESLLSSLAGDFMLKLHVGFGLHFRFEILGERKAGTDGLKFTGKIIEAYYTIQDGKRLSLSNPPIGPLLFSFPLEQVITDHDSHIDIDFVVTEDTGMMFAQQALGMLRRDQGERWKVMLGRVNPEKGAISLRKSAEYGLGHHITHIIGNLVPHNYPDWFPLSARFQKQKSSD